MLRYKGYVTEKMLATTFIPALGARISSSPEVSSRPQRLVWSKPFHVYAGNNKPGPNFIEIGSGSASREAWDEVRVIRTTADSPVRSSRSSNGGRKSAPVKNLLQADVPPQEQEPIVEVTKRARAGKTVTVVKRLQLTDESLESLCKTLKGKLGTGGAVKDLVIEIQGDHSAKLVEALVELGYKARMSGR